MQFCTTSFPQALIPTLGDLVIVESDYSRLRRQDGIDPGLCRELLQQFTGAINLYLYSGIASRIALVLQELVRESVSEIFPVLQNIFLRQPPELVPEGIKQFVAARRLANHPISISRW